MNEDYYKILEVHPEAGIEVIEKAYRALAMRYHPDRNAGHKQKWAEEKFKQLSGAYSVLKDPFLRREYDRDLRAAQRIAARAAGNAPEARSGNPQDDEKAYFHYQMGLGYFQKVALATSLEILLGKHDLFKEKAKTEFETVIQKHPQSQYCEECFYRLLVILNEAADHSEAFLSKLETQFADFEEKYPSGAWIAEVKLEFAKFQALKRNDPGEARKILRHLASHYTGSDFISEIRALEEYLLELERRPRPKGREKVHV